MSNPVKKSLEYARLELLDMGLRGNTLLHFRQNAKTLEVVDEVSAEVYRIFVEQNKAMTFSAVPDSLVDEDDQVDNSQPLPALLEEMYGSGRHVDTKLQTKLTTEKLDKRLLKVSTEARTYYEEQGVDILYLALGFLTWFEDKNSSNPRKAPLVLIPVALERSSAKERFKISYTQADIGPNLSLAAKLQMEFNIELPEFGEELDIVAYFNEVAERIKDQPRWKINVDDIAIGFFSFGKFQMYQDLDGNNWPANKQPSDHPVLNGLLGEGFGGESLADGGLGDDRASKALELVDLHFVKDADSSQTEAVMAVKQGSNLVIQGPPGTGKSQTITNIISESLADGKRILFVAEKMAALDVVKRRLDECQLGDAVLELHSHKSNKKSVLEELKRTFELGAPAVEDRTPDKRRHSRLQDQLDTYSNQVNEPILNSSVSYIDALGHHLQLKKTTDDQALPELDFTGMREWTRHDFDEACLLVKELVEHLETMGVPAENAFADSRLEDFSPIEQNQIVNLLTDSLALVELCKKEASALAIDMELQEPNTLDDIQALHRAATRAVAAPHLAGLSLTTDDWQQRRDQLRELISAGSEISQLKKKRENQLIDQAWGAELLTTRSVWATTGHSWWRFLSSEFRQAKRTLQGLLRSELPKAATDCVDLIDDILKFQTLNEVFSKHQLLGESLFGAQWQGESSDWEVLAKLTEWVIELYDEVGKGDLPKGLLRFLEGVSSVEEWQPRLEQLASHSALLEKTVGEVMVRLSTELPGQGNRSLQHVDLSNLIGALESWQQRIDDLYQMTRYNRLRQSFKRSGLTEIGELSYEWALPAKLLLTTMKMSWYSGLVAEAYKQREALRQFDRVSQENVIDEFKRLDKKLFNHAQEALMDKLHQQMPSSAGAGEMAVVRREMNKKRRHLPIRKLISQAGRAIQQAKPVFMMSPMSVATYLEQGAVEFDLVVFDEASQIKVVDAFGPILRGHQVVVVGDTKQMPPTDFFGRALELDDDDADESQTADIESILSMFLSQGAAEAMLRWHYRSRHDSLIAVSNQEFYDGKLMVFPSPGVHPDATGLKFNYLPDTVYERGESRTNPGEARAIAETVMLHAKTKPTLTLGVVAFSTAQRDCILLEVERLRREDPSCEPFFNIQRDDGETFFVKNLENVQGDERDIILISIAYGRTAAGSIPKSFGPINREGGQRRLNVLITRARLGMEVFSNFCADDLKTDESTPFGVKSLKNFLKYAETGNLERLTETGKETDSPFEDEVISAIRQLGYDVEPQVGSAGFFIDIAVRDPKKPGRYVLAVECDGATYHSSASARDRDRLRQDVLEGLGWRFHRIWSTDWFRNPHKEMQRVKESIQKAIEFYEKVDAGQVIEESTVPLEEAKPARVQRVDVDTDISVSANPYTLVSGEIGIPVAAEIHELDHPQIQSAVKAILAVEGPIHLKEAARRITESAGHSRVGQRIMKHVEKAVAEGHKQNCFHVDNGFIYQDEKKATPLRDRSALPTAMKKIELVPSEEMAESLETAVKMAFSLTKQDAVAEALSLMGFQRSTEKARMYMDSSLEGLVASGKLIQDGEIISLPQ
ncbi:DUF3320 domain-containing protein [Neptuniibacter marinus]|uniref:DUF3320 domain-containing protein n=1 Tax=Neptuniibacter marinus TaxID=1806670 RepID=UPI003B5CA003